MAKTEVVALRTTRTPTNSMSAVRMRTARATGDVHAYGSCVLLGRLQQAGRLASSWAATMPFALAETDRIWFTLYVIAPPTHIVPRLARPIVDEVKSVPEKNSTESMVPPNTVRSRAALVAVHEPRLSSNTPSWRQTDVGRTIDRNREMHNQHTHAMANGIGGWEVDWMI